MKTARKIISYTLWTIVLFYLGVAVLLHVPAVQQWTGGIVASALAGKLGTRVQIGRVDLGFLNRIIIDDVQIWDQHRQKMLSAGRLSAKVDLVPLFDGQVRISSAQAFGLAANLYQQNADTPPNFQFVLDSLASKSKSPKTPLDLQIQSLVIRNGAVSWNRHDIAPTARKFNPAHLNITGLSTHIILNKLTDDSISLKVKHFALKEASGLDVRSLKFRFNAGKHSASLSNFVLNLPQSHLALPSLTARYRMKGKQLDKESLSYHVLLSPSSIRPADLTFIEPALKRLHQQVTLQAEVKGTAKQMDISQLRLESSDHTLSVNAQGSLRQLHSTPAWAIAAKPLKVSAEGIQVLASALKGQKLELPAVVSRLGRIDFRGSANGQGKRIAAKGRLSSDAGEVAFSLKTDGQHFTGTINTPQFNLQRLLDNPRFGILAANLNANGRIPQGNNLNLRAQGTISEFDYNGYRYRNISMDGSYTNDIFNGTVALNDPNGRLTVKGQVSHLRSFLAHRTTAFAVKASAEASAVNLQRLRLTDALGNRTFSLQAKADVEGHSLDDLNGTVDINNFTAIGEGDDYRIARLHLETLNNSLLRRTRLSSDFADINMEGQYRYDRISDAFIGVIQSKIPSLTGARKHPLPTNDRFSFYAQLRNSDLLKRFAHLPLDLHQPLTVEGNVNGRQGEIDASVTSPSLTYSGNRLDNLNIRLATLGDSLHVTTQADRISPSGRPFSVALRAAAADDKVVTRTLWDAHGNHPTHGEVNANVLFFREKGHLGTHIYFSPSEEVFDTVRLTIQPSDLVYAHKRLEIHHFEVSNGSQHIIINGQTTGSEADSLLVDLQDINVPYILDVVNFHSVRFGGRASGTAVVKSVFSHPVVNAQLAVNDFTFQDGEMGTLQANVNFDSREGQINIDALADDGPDAQTLIKGYVSTKRNYIDLPIYAHGTRLKFLESFCGSFMDNVDAHAKGHLRVFGDLKDVNLEGDLRASGQFDVTPLHTTYSMKHAHVRLIPDNIIMDRDTVYDRDGHIGILTGSLHHESLRHLTYDLQVDAHNFLAYDHKTYEGNTFFGTVYGTGTCNIKGRSGEIVMDVQATPEEGSFIEYNAGYAGTLDDANFIRWNDVTPTDSDSISSGKALSIHSPFREPADDDIDIRSDMHINFLVNTTPDFTLRVLMDEASGDYIALNGDGFIRATYFNKGAFQMYGNYNVQQGLYKLTIQNVIKKEFHFQPGSLIAFGGDPYNAALNLKALYTVNGASLSDLQLGNSFTRNNVRVNCLMNITGTPLKPAVDFNLDLPTLSADAQQMVKSVINSEEDMNQQVLYLLAVGRFYPQGNNNAVQENAAQSQTSLAMQSLLSGTISQQINTVLSNVIKSNDWNFGANISTGNEGFSNAEYEGILSGRMLNNRLLFNGQFGYRDNVTTNNSSFIGDFDLRYLLVPNGNVAIRVYNQTNDRYFTRNSLNTQGVGVILKRDFNGLRDLFGSRKRKQKKAQNVKKH